MLLPRPVYNEEGEEIDPREELVQRLLEYKRYKEVLGQLSKMEEEQRERKIRSYGKKEENSFSTLSFPKRNWWVWTSTRSCGHLSGCGSGTMTSCKNHGM